MEVPIVLHSSTPWMRREKLGASLNSKYLSSPPLIVPYFIRPWRIPDRRNHGAVLRNAEAKDREVSRGRAAVHGIGHLEPGPDLRLGRPVQVWPRLPQQNHAGLQLGQTKAHGGCALMSTLVDVLFGTCSYYSFSLCADSSLYFLYI